MTRPVYIWRTHQQIGVKGEPTNFVKWRDTILGIAEQNFPCRYLYINDLTGSPAVPIPEASYFSGGCGAVEALARAVDLVGNGVCEVVVICGNDHFATMYRDSTRQKIIDAANKTFSQSVTRFCAERKIALKDFLAVLSALNENYEFIFDQVGAGVWEHRPFGDDLVYSNPGVIPVSLLPDKTVNYVGDVLITTEELAKALGAKRLTMVLGVAACDSTRDEGREFDRGLCPQLTAAKVAAEEAAGIKIRAAVESGAKPEVWPLSPVDTVRFLQDTGLTTFLADLPGFLAKHPVTVEGRREFTLPWSMVALRGIIELHRSLAVGGKGVLHAASADGKKQSVAIFQRKQ